MPDLQRRMPERRARALGSLPALTTRSRLNRTFSTPPSTVIDNLDVLISRSLRPQGWALQRSDVRSELCTSAPSGSAMGSTGVKRGAGGVFMGIESRTPAAASHCQQNQILATRSA